METERSLKSLSFFILFAHLVPVSLHPRQIIYWIEYYHTVNGVGWGTPSPQQFREPKLFLKKYTVQVQFIMKNLLYYNLL